MCGGVVFFPYARPDRTGYIRSWVSGLGHVRCFPLLDSVCGACGWMDGWMDGTHGVRLVLGRLAMCVRGWDR